MTFLKRAAGALLALAFVTPVLAGSSLPPGTPVDAYGNAPRANLGYAAQQFVPVCNNTGINGNGNLTNTGGTTPQSRGRRVLYCPNGFKSLQLVLTGFYVSSSPAEVDLTAPVPINLGVEISVAKPWLSTTTYSIGDTVNWAGAQYTAAAGNTNSMPSASNANWTSLAVSRIVAVTCNGGRICTVPTATSPSGSTVTQPVYKTDVIPVSCTSACWIAVDFWIAQTGSQQYAIGRTGNYWLGEYWAQAATETDASLTGGNLSPPQGSFSPYMIGAAIGIPNDNRPTVCVAGDSRAAGATGHALYVGTGVTSGGSSYVASDIGKVTTLSNAGGSGNFVYLSAQAIITGVSGGAVTSTAMIDAGDYSIAASGIVMPSGAQTLTGGGTTGSGATITPFEAGGFDYGDNFGGKGYIERGLDAAGIPWVSVSRSSDTVAAWITRDYDRLAFIQAVGCRDVLVELMINDIGSSSAATIEANLVKIGTDLASLGTVKGVYLLTAPPVSTSTDGFATLVNQTTNTNNGVRVAVNNWIRGTPTPFSGYFETADLGESSRDSGLWTVTGVTCQVICDSTGFHPTRYGHALMAPAITNNIGILH